MVMEQEWKFRSKAGSGVNGLNEVAQAGTH
jgi:hypothetical protein